VQVLRQSVKCKSVCRIDIPRLGILARRGGPDVPKRRKEFPRLRRRGDFAQRIAEIVYPAALVRGVGEEAPQRGHEPLMLIRDGSRK